MSAEQLAPAFENFTNSSEVDLEGVLSLQALVMGHVRSIAGQKGRKLHTRGNPRAHSYCLMKNGGIGITESEEVYNGAKDQFFGVRVRRLGFRAWSMGILLQENEMSKEASADIARTVFRFRWNDETAMGRKETPIPYLEEEASTGMAGNGILVFEPPERDYLLARSPIVDRDIEEIRQQILSIAEAATSRAA